MKIQNIVDYLTTKAVDSDDEKGYITIQETVYRINDNYTYSYFTEYEEALRYYAGVLDIIMTNVIKGDVIASGVLRLDYIEVDYYANVIRAREVYEHLMHQDLNLYEFEYTRSKKEG